ncbi:MAG: DUF1648 domain-containing protein [Chloroflexi bacterium]|nr:DUF1648 domain-containing protein [Chloroflexota bacterium]
MLIFGLGVAGLLVLGGIATYVLAPRVGPNPWFGVRTGYSMANPEVWAKSNRVGGRLLVGIGIAMALLTLLVAQLGLGADSGIAVLAGALVLMLAGSVAWLFSYTRTLARLATEDKDKVKVERLPFRWRYVALPLALCLASLILVACFYPRLEGARLATHFSFSGQPDGWMGRSAFVAIMLAIQFGFAGISLALVRWLSAWLRPGAPAQVSASASQWLLGNLLAVGQMVVLYAMADTFWYNLYQAHLLPVWLFIILAVISATLVPLFAIAVVIGGRWLSNLARNSSKERTSGDSTN